MGDVRGKESEVRELGDWGENRRGKWVGEEGMMVSEGDRMGGREGMKGEEGGSTVSLVSSPHTGRGSTRPGPTEAGRADHPGEGENHSRRGVSCGHGDHGERGTRRGARQR